MYLNNANPSDLDSRGRKQLAGLGGYGTSDFNKALKSTNIAAIQKGLDFQKKQLSKRKPKDTKGIAADEGQIRAAEARLLQLTASTPAPSIAAGITQAVANNSSLIATPAPAPLTITPPPLVTSGPKMDPGAYGGVPATIPSAAPPAASDAVATLAPAPLNYGPPTSNFGPPMEAPSFSPVTDPQAAASEAQAAPAENSKMPLILLGVGVLAFFMRSKKGR